MRPAPPAQNKNNLQAGMIVAGYDERHGGQVFGIPLGGTLVQVPFTAGGSGSAYITGFMDKNFRPDMTEEECKSFVVRSLAYAMCRDASSGGCIRTVTIDRSGQRRDFIKSYEIPLCYDELPMAARR
jgi:20S proteasome subunit beta 1